MELILRNYQIDIINKTRELLKQGAKSPVIVLPCGSGKTVCFAFMAAESQKRGKSVWFLVHRQELLTQTVETFKKFNIPLQNIFIGMIATVARNLEKYPKPDLIIFDEAHFSAAATWGKIISAFPDAIKIGLTATPVRLDNKPLGNIYDSMVTGVTAKHLIESGMLSKYQYFAPSVADLSMIKSKAGDFDQNQAAEVLLNGDILGDIIKHYRDLANNKKAICYCPTIKFSEKITGMFQAAGINAVHFDGETPDKQRKQIIADFRAGVIKILCNVDLISVGFDVPDCECCILLRPTHSTALFIQQSMRALRPLQDKTAIILDHVGNYTRHGLPDDDREWNLGKKIKRIRQSSDPLLFVRQCPACFFTYSSRSNECPNCGYVKPREKEEIKIIKKIKLQEIKSHTVVPSRWQDCKNRLQLQKYAEQKGYKPGWVFYKKKELNL